MGRRLGGGELRRPSDRADRGGGGFDGRIDEVRIYGRALSGEEVRADETTPLQTPARAAGPIAVYPLTEGEGDVAHDVAGEHDATIKGAEWVSGSGLHFDGTSEDSVEIPMTPPFDAGSPFTFEARVKSEGEEEEAPIIATNTAQGDGLYVFGPGGHPGSLLATAGGPPLAIESSEGLGSAWTFLTLTSDGEHLRLYANGVQVDSAAEAGIITSEGDLRLGGIPSLNRYFTGDIEGVRIYDRALSQAEIESDYGESPSRPTLSVTGPIFEAGPEAVVGPEQPIAIEVEDSGGNIRQIDLLLGGEVDRVITAEEAFRGGATEKCTVQGCHFDYTFDPELGGGDLESPSAVGIRVIDSYGASTMRTHTVQFDSAPPKLRLNGDVGQIEDAEAGNLELEALDDSAQPETGISAIRVAMDGEIIQSEQYECTPSCPETETAEWSFESAKWAEGPHRLIVTAVDGVGNETEEQILIGAEPILVGPRCSGEAQGELPELGENATATEAREIQEDRLPGAFLDGPEQRGEAFGEQDWTTDGGSVWASEQGATNVRAQKRPGGNFTIGAGACLMPTSVGAAETEGTRFPNWLGVVYANSAPDTDTTLRPTPLGMAIIEDIRGPAAPLSFSWEVPLDASEEFVELEGGGVAIVKPDGIEIDPAEVPDVPAGVEDPENLSAGDLQAEAALDEIQEANAEVQGQVMGIIAPPVALVEGGGLVPGALSVEGDVVTATRAEGSQALVVRASSTPNPAAMCAESSPYEPEAYLADCGPEEAEDPGVVSAIASQGEGFVFVFESFPEEAGELSTTQLYKADGDGKGITQMTNPAYEYLDPQVAPDGSAIVATRCALSGGECGVVLLNAEGEGDLLLASSTATGTGFDPTFSANSQEIFFYKDTPTGLNGGLLDRQLYAVDVTGGYERQVTDVDSSADCGDEAPCNLGLGATSGPPAVSPDNEDLVVSASGQLWDLPWTGEKLGWEETSSISTGGGGVGANEPVFSPDGSTVAYFGEGEEGTEDGIYVVAAAGGTPEEVAAYPGTPGGVRSLDYTSDGSALVFSREGSAFELQTEGKVEHLLTDGEERASISDSVTAQTPSQAGKAVEALEAFRGEASESLGGIQEGIEGASEFELFWCLSNLVNAVECKFFIDDRGTAISMRQRIFTDRNAHFDRSTKGNAFQHAFWTALMVDDSPELESQPGFSDGLLFALNHETEPLSRDAEEDVLNDYMGNGWLFFHDDDEMSDIDICEGLRVKSRRDQHIPRKKPPFTWANENEYKYNTPVFRVYRSNLGRGSIVRLNGRECAEGGAS